MASADTSEDHQFELMMGIQDWWAPESVIRAHLKVIIAGIIAAKVKRVEVTGYYDCCNSEDIKCPELLLDLIGSSVQEIELNCIAFGKLTKIINDLTESGIKVVGFSNGDHFFERDNLMGIKFSGLIISVSNDKENYTEQLRELLADNDQLQSVTLRWRYHKLIGQVVTTLRMLLDSKRDLTIKLILTPQIYGPLDYKQDQKRPKDHQKLIAILSERKVSFSVEPLVPYSNAPEVPAPFSSVVKAK